MSLRSILLLSALVLAPLWGEAKVVKPKAPTQSPEQLLREAERAYHAYQFGPASTVLSKYISSLQRLRQAVPDSVTMLQEQIARAERMYGTADELRVVDSTLVGIDRLADFLIQINRCSLPVEMLPIGIRPGFPVEAPAVGDSLHSAPPAFPLLGFIDLLHRNSIIPDGRTLAWFAMVGDYNWERQEIATKTLEADAPIRSPFLLEDGMTLFFARRSPAGLGGYDLYMTRLTEQGNSFFEPTLLGMPYNSPYNDYLLAYHESRNWGFLISDRFAPEGQVHVYRFTGRPAFLAGRQGGETKELSEEEAYRRATLSGVLYEGKVPAMPIDEELVEVPEQLFLLHGSEICYEWPKFKTDAGRRAVAEAKALRSSLAREKFRLYDLRTRWREGDAAVRSELRSEILHLEVSVREKTKQYRDLLNAVRRHAGIR